MHMRVWTCGGGDMDYCVMRMMCCVYIDSSAAWMEERFERKGGLDSRDVVEASELFGFSKQVSLERRREVVSKYGTRELAGVPAGS